VGLSPKGERALFAARGDIFHGPNRKGSNPQSDALFRRHDKWPAWSPDGSRIAFISDATGEEELYIAPQDGLKPAEQITRGGNAMRYQPEWSPDGKRIAFSDKNGKVYVVTLADRKMVEIADAPHGQIRDYTWSPRGTIWLSVSMRILIVSQPSMSGARATASCARSRMTCLMPTVPPGIHRANYIYFLADREFQPQISQIEFNYATNRTAYIYAIALRKDVKHPFPPESDEVTITKLDDTPKPPAPKGVPAGEEPKPPAKDINKELKEPAKEPTPEGEKPGPAATPTPGGESKSDATAKTTAPLTIDFDGIIGRAARVPVGADNYGGLSAKTGHLLYAVGSAFYTAVPEIVPLSLDFCLQGSQESTIAEEIRGYTLSEDGSKVLVAQGPAYNLYDATPQGDKTKKPVSTAGLFVDRIPAEEWNQIFNEVWRRYRDWFYVPNMHGYDWIALREQYKPLLQYVAHRSDLNYVISEMISELTIQHAYIEAAILRFRAAAQWFTRRAL